MIALLLIIFKIFTWYALIGYSQNFSFEITIRAQKAVIERGCFQVDFTFIFSITLVGQQLSWISRALFTDWPI